jgi:hypothetical protein
MVTRFWAASTGYIIMAAKGVNKDIPDFPFDKAGIERELCIWLGYLDFLRPVVQADLGTRLLRVFVGVVDNVKGVGSATGGETVAIQLRDRMKWLMDTVVTYNPATDKTAGDAPLRSNLILEVAQRGIGQVENDQGGCAVCGKKILWDQQYLYDIGDKGPNNASPDISNIPPADLWYQNNGPLAASTRTRSIKVNDNPYFRIYTTRAAVNLQQGTNFLVSQQIPVDVLKYLAMQEVYPTEVFQDSRDGNLYYAPRANDVSGLSDSKRFYRTYFYKRYPDSLPVGGGDACPPDPNQMLLAFSEEQSSIGLKTNFYVTKSSPTAQNGAGDDWTLHLRVKPNSLPESYACHYARVYDDTITTPEEAAVVALNAARIMGKEVRAGLMVCLGDPSLTPGEVIQVLGSVIQPTKGFSSALEDRQKFLDYNNRYNQNLKTYAEESIKNAGKAADTLQGASVSLPLIDGSSVTMNLSGSNQQNQDSLNCNPSTQNTISSVTTMWRVEAVVYKLNQGSKGFSTEVALCDPF